MPLSTIESRTMVRPTRPSHLATRRYRSKHTSSTPPAVATPSPRWKETLRQACLDRARQKRRDHVLRKRQRLSLEFEAEADSLEEDQQPARMVIEEELRRQGVSIQSPCFEEGSRDEDVIFQPSMNSATIDVPGEPMSITPTAVPPSENDHVGSIQPKSILVEDTNGSHHVITESDLFDILQEVENELQRDEDLFVEELLEEDRSAELYLQDQIAEYEQWEENLMNGMPEASEEQTICPICQRSNLVVTKDRFVVCPRPSCTFRWEYTRTNCPLQFLREHLRSAHEEHASGCFGTLRFASRRLDTGHSTVVAGCDGCGLSFTVL